MHGPSAGKRSESIVSIVFLCTVIRQQLRHNTGGGKRKEERSFPISHAHRHTQTQTRTHTHTHTCTRVIRSRRKQSHVRL